MRKEIFVILVTLSLVGGAVCLWGNMFSEGHHFTVIQIMYEQLLKENKHCENMHASNTKNWTFSEAKIEHKKLQNFMKIFRTDAPYFPAGNLSETQNHSYVSRFTMSLVLTFILLCLVMGLLLIPCPCWGKAWLNVLSNPYSVYSQADASDSISTKEKLTKIKKTIQSFPLVEETHKLKNFCSVLVFAVFSLTTWIILSSNFGKSAQCGVVGSLSQFFDDKSTGFLRYFGMTKNNMLARFKQELYDYTPRQEFLESITQAELGQSSRILERDLQEFVDKFQSRSIHDCSNSIKSYQPYTEFF